MRLRLLVWFGLIGFGIAVAASQGQEGGDKKKEQAFPVPKPGEEHKMLAKTQGNWNASVKSWFGPGEPNLSKGVMNRKVILDGLYVQETYTGEFMGMKFSGMGLLGYDQDKKKFHFTWIDNVGTGVMTNYGTYDASTKTITYTGEEDNPMFGGKVKTRDVIKIVSDDEQIFEMYRTPVKEGKEMKVLEIHYTRAKKAKK